MKTKHTEHRRRPTVALLLVTLLVLAGCATGNAQLKRADAYGRLGEWDSAIAHYQQILKEEPENREIRGKLEYAKVNAALLHTSEGKKLAAAGDLQRAQLELELATRYDPSNAAAMEALTDVNEAIAEKERLDEMTRTPIEQAIAASMAQPDPLPELRHIAMGTMTFDYRRARLKEIYRAFGRLGGINVLFDPELDNPSTSFFLADVTYQHALDILTSTNGHFYRVMAPNTILIAEDSQQKRRQYEPQLLRTFYLSNAEAEEVATTLQTILQARQVAANPSLNAVTIRDTADVVKVATRMVSSLDKARGEVMLQIEIFEVDRGTLDEWGLSLSDYGTTLSIAQATGESGPAGISIGDLGSITNQDVFITVPSLRYQFLKQDNSFQVIAQPQLRASDGQVSSLLVGEQRPIETTTFNPSSTVGGNVVPIGTIEYRDVGIVIEATPRVHHDGMITLQLNLQITAVQPNSVGAQDQPVFTARTLTTTLRLREGETNVLAGLLRDDERTQITGLPILSDIPVLKELFSKTETEVQSTDIVLSITPYIVRMANIEEEDLLPIYVGTENALTGGGASGRRGSRDSSDDDEEEDGSALEERAPINVAILPADVQAAVGDQIELEVVAQGGANVNNAGMRISYDPRVLRFIEAIEGDVLSSDGAETSFQTSAAASGSVAVGIGRVGGGRGVLASGTLVRFVFEAIGEGDATVQVMSAAIRDEQGRPLPLELEPAQVIVQ
jgi:general secretion pathway protein D